MLKILDLNKKQIFFVFILSIFVIGVINNALKPKILVDPCECSEIGADAQIIGYENLNEETKKKFSDCEKVYNSPAEAFNACVDKVSNNLNKK